MPRRLTNEAWSYFRRSTGKQEASIPQQHAWAAAKARELGLKFTATLSDVEYMLEHGLHAHKGMFLDDGITGADLDRPGFLQIRRQAMLGPDPSHILIYMPDRFARPDKACQAMQAEVELLYAGLTVVFSNRVALPRQRGLNYFADDIAILYSYTESGEFLNKLAVRMVDSLKEIAENGFWAGGRPPYGFIRTLVDATGREICEMEHGTSIRRDGCHTRIKPKDMAKIAVWIDILQMYHGKKYGAKAVCAHLNGLGIPSPDQGRTRTDRGLKHNVSGKWHPNTVLSLIRNWAINAQMQYGFQSEGAHRRLSANGPRLLEPSDFRPDGKAKVIRNPEELIIRRPAGYEPLVDPDLFEKCQRELKERGRNHRGISRRVDPNRYPLALRIYDQTDGCGHPMYARMSGKRTLYVCGRYMNGAGCSHNAIDGEAALRFVLGVLHQRAGQFGGREALRRKLLAFAQAPKPPKPEPRVDGLKLLESRLRVAEEELRLIERNFVRARNDHEVEMFRRELEGQEAVMTRLRGEIDEIQAKTPVDTRPDPSDPEQQAE